MLIVTYESENLLTISSPHGILRVSNLTVFLEKRIFMNVADAVLELLQESPGPISGEEMARRLAVSRNSVWKAVNKLKEAGYEISAVTNRGYQLLSESNVLSSANIRRQLSGAAEQVLIDIRESVTSTNTVLKEIAEQGGKEGMVVIAEQQSSGKGRLGRSFYSPKGSGLYLSILLRPRFSAEESLSITTAAAVAVAEAVDAVTGEASQIKWVNDVYFHGKKVCGILTEASVDFENNGLHYAVLGIGVNLREPEDGFTGELQKVAGALFREAPPPGSRAKLAAEILNRFFAYYRALPVRTFMPEYRKRSLLTGMEITFQVGEKLCEGTVLGVDDQARLRIRLPDGTETGFGAGEVNIKKDFLERLSYGERQAVR